MCENAMTIFRNGPLGYHRGTACRLSGSRCNPEKCNNHDEEFQEALEQVANALGLEIIS